MICSIGDKKMEKKEDLFVSLQYKKFEVCI